MKVYVIRDSAFTLNNGVPSSDLLSYDNFAKRYLARFDEVILVGRLFKKEDAAAKPAVGPGVSFKALPGYHGPIGFIKNIPGIIRVVMSTLERDAAYILRIPTTVPSIYAFVLRLLRIPFFVEVAADPYDGYSARALNNNILSPFFQLLFVAMTRWQCKRANGAAYVTANALQSRYPPGNSARSFSFTSIDLHEDAYVDISRAESDFNLTQPRLVMIGNMQKTLKGHDVLLKSLAELRLQGYNVCLTIIGYGENRAVYEKLASDLGILDFVEFTGKLQNGDPIRKILDTSDLFVLPSRQEGLPRALLEAMARGLPAIASRVGGTPELLDDDSLVEPDDVTGLRDKIKFFLDNPGFMMVQSARNLEVSRRYRVEEVTRQRLAFYENIITVVESR
ncbi:glycosyltransferase [[Pseudomonas] boreopolis]|uniref:glycosyltransferase n=1 Tax=Xanthomonas boreopolis TaxID=86183 RepID=UPI003D55A951